jgi:hypothetical protein
MTLNAYSACAITLSVIIKSIMLNVIMLSVIMLNVVVPSLLDNFHLTLFVTSFLCLSKTFVLVNFKNIIFTKPYQTFKVTALMYDISD